jgi:geranylgeranyl reductase
MVAPSDRHVDMPINGGYVGMVDREPFDEWLRERAAERRRRAPQRHLHQAHPRRDGTALIHYRPAESERPQRSREAGARPAVIGADGAMSSVAKQCIPGAKELPHVAAYHEIVRSPAPTSGKGLHDFEPSRCDVYYQGKLSPDFYAWIFPHGETTSIGVGTELKGFSLHDAVDQLRKETGLDQCETIRREGAPIPLHPLPKWDNDRDVVLAGDAAGVVAPASGEGIYYALVGGGSPATRWRSCWSPATPRRWPRRASAS